MTDVTQTIHVDKDLEVNIAAMFHLYSDKLGRYDYKLTVIDPTMGATTVVGYWNSVQSSFGVQYDQVYIGDTVESNTFEFSAIHSIIIAVYDAVQALWENESDPIITITPTNQAVLSRFQRLDLGVLASSSTPLVQYRAVNPYTYYAFYGNLEKPDSDVAWIHNGKYLSDFKFLAPSKWTVKLWQWEFAPEEKWGYGCGGDEDYVLIATPETPDEILDFVQLAFPYGDTWVKMDDGRSILVVCHA